MNGLVKYVTWRNMCRLVHIKKRWNDMTENIIVAVRCDELYTEFSNGALVWYNFKSRNQKELKPYYEKKLILFGSGRFTE